jgi:hypothetical protein
MIRGIVGTILGLLVAVAVIIGMELLGHALYPPPAEIRAAMEKRDYAAMKAAVAEYLPRAPLMALILVPVGWVAGAFWGALAATGISRGRSIVPALIVGGLVLAGTVMNLLMIPHPGWMFAAGLVGVPLAALAAWWLWPKASTSGPQPYDMREKNVAC